MGYNSVSILRIWVLDCSLVEAISIVKKWRCEKENIVSQIAFLSITFRVYLISQSEGLLHKTSN